MRYFNVFGRRQSPDGAYAAVIPKFIKLLLNGERPTINGDGQQSRDFTYVENVIEANLKACLAPSEAAGEAFNIAYGGREFLNDIYFGLTKALNVDIQPQRYLQRHRDHQPLPPERQLLDLHHLLERQRQRRRHCRCRRLRHCRQRHL